MTAGPLLLVGAGGLAREVLAAVRAINTVAARWAVLGFLDDNPARHGQSLDGVPVLGPLGLAAQHTDAAIVICTGSPRDLHSRRRISERLAMPEERYATIVHPAASVAQGTRLGRGSVFLAFVAVTAPQEIGRHVVVMPHTTITHDDRISDYVTFGSRVAVSGGVSIGEAAYLGSGALIREGLSIGPGALVGMGAVVLDDVPASEVWIGAPARRLRTLDPAAGLAETAGQRGQS
jgi:sugar O-acyltransferase (sialic acid O-acetyltransferase NeuD family)